LAVRIHDDLRDNERDFGLGTTAEESEWKLMRIVQGHRRFFAALGWFVAHGNHVAVVKGNHDVEFHWRQVRERLIMEVKRAYARERLETGEGLSVTSQEFGERIHFYPWFYHESGRIYVEHGGQYEAANHFRDYLNPVLPDDPQRIELPLGSLFVRYLFNEVEDVHPFADNVKPITRYLGWAFRADRVKAVKVLVTRGPVFLRALWNVARKTLSSVLRRERKGNMQLDSVPLPPDVREEIVALAERQVAASRREWFWGAVRGLLSLVLALAAIAFLVLAGLTLTGGLGRVMAVYLGAAVLAYFLRLGLMRGLAGFLESEYLLRVARDLERILKPAGEARYIVFGHDHRPAIERLEEAWYINTGAWVPLYEKGGPIDGREALSFFRLARGYEDTPELLRWDDAAGEPARMVLWEDVDDW
jgi:UDP-2,3-diacylglucosamine pyrophosphatase LpxH